MRPKGKGNSISDRRGSKVTKKKSEKEGIQKKHNNAHQAESKETKCSMNINFFISPHDGYWYLNKNSNMQHSFHFLLNEDSSLLNKDNLNQTQMDMIHEMYNIGIPDSSIAEIMSNLVNKSGTKGEFSASTIRNITTERQNAVNKIADVSSDWSIAKKTIAKLDA